MKTATAVGLALAGAVGLAAAAAAALGFAIARRLTAPPSGRVYDLTVRDVLRVDGQPAVVLNRTPRTAAPGLYNLWVEGGGWVKLGAVLESADETITRAVQSEEPTGVLRRGQCVSWSGVYYRDPADAGLDAEDVLIDAPVGPAPAWLIRPSDAEADHWAIHIHGLGGRRAGTLRGVRVAAAARLTSLVVSYRNDGDGPEVGTGRSTLGVDETADVRAAVHYAIAHGARRVVLFGWSMGASIAIELAADVALRGVVIGLVLDSPVLDWNATVAANCARAGLPAWGSALAHPWLRTPIAQVAWIARSGELSIPTLILHGTEDSSTPFRVSAQLRNLLPEITKLEAFNSDHTMTWNAEVERWDYVVEEWLIGRCAVGRRAA